MARGSFSPANLVAPGGSRALVPQAPAPKKKKQQEDQPPEQAPAAPLPNTYLGGTTPQPSGGL